MIEGSVRAAAAVSRRTERKDTMMKKAIVLAGALCAASLGGLSVAAAEPQAQPQQAPLPTLDKQDMGFVTDVAQGNLTEIRLGEIVARNATNDEVRKYAQRMVDDHTKLNTQLATLMQQRKGVALPTALDKKHQDEVDKLAKETGDKLDRDYMSRMVDEHEKDVKAFEKIAKDAKDPELKQFASGALPTLQDHLTRAKEIESRVKK
ncbi:putative exported protein [Minicystis rosea]|nr:putative exported protein [Minicystis rosea]